MKRLLFVLILLAVGVIATTAQTSFNYANFASTAGLNLTGNAAPASNAVRLTTNAQGQTGSAFYNSPVPVANFSTSFQFRITDLVGGGADGFSFSVRQGGPALENGAAGEAGTNEGLALQFDTFQNQGDPSNNFIRLRLNGDALATSSVLPVNLKDGNIHTVVINVRQGQEISVLLDGQPLISVGSVNLASISPAYVGFAARTGGSAETHDIVSWSFTSSVLTVTKTADTNDGVCDADCSLREAIVAANAAATDEVINFDAGVFAGTQTITLTLGELSIANNGTLTINGTGANLLTISGNNSSRVFIVASGAIAAIGGVRITGGNSPGNGGGIFNFGSLNLTNSTVSGNSAGNVGGGIANFGTLNVTNSTVSGNTTSNSGGGIANGGTTNLTNSTVSGNSSVNTGGGISNVATVNVTNSTITANSSNSGGGIFTDLSTVRARNTISSGNFAPNSPDLSGTLAVNENNLIGGNASLAPLGNYGGATQTHALLGGSTAINAGNNCVRAQNCPTYNAPVAVAADQRGRSRDSQVDIGAFEVVGLTVTKTADTNDGVCDTDCSLREAVAAAQSGDTIQFASPLFDTAQTVQVNGQITIDKSLFIVGSGAARTTLQSIATPSSTSRIFLILGGTVSISRLSLTGANLSGAATLPGCTQICGGAIYNSANLTLSETVFHGNQITGTDGSNRFGGAVTSTGTLTVSSSAFFNNSIQSAAQSFMYGGALASAGSTLIVNSTFSNNSISSSSSSFVQLFGGGIVSFAGSVTALNSTVANNRLSATASTAQCFGGGALIATSLVGNTLIAGNGTSCLGFTSGPDVDGFNSLGNNLVGNTSGTTITGTTTGNILNQDPLLAPLGYYGGATPTHALLSGSPAINGGNNCVTNQTCATFNPPSPLTADQRGAARVGNVDIGAFEANSSANGGNFRGRLPDGLINSPYNFALVPSNGSTTYAVTGGALPPGMNLTTAFAPSAVVSLTGTPTSGGVFNFTVTATNGANTSVTDYRLDIVNPTAAGVSVSGRVMTSEGRGLANAVVILTDANGESRNVRTGSFGYFRFEDIAAGQSVIVEVRSKRFSFAPQVVFVGDEIANLEFVGNP